MFKKEKKGSVFLYREKRGPLNKQVRKKKLMDFGLLGPFRSGTLWTGTIDRAGKSRTLHNKRNDHAAVKTVSPSRTRPPG